MNVHTLMKKRLVVVLALAIVILIASSPALAIIWGVEDLDGHFPNVASIRGVYETDGQLRARYSCSGSLLHVDDDKFVILTAAHCTDAWIGGLASGILDTVGVSFDQNNVINGDFGNATYYVTGGVPISFPQKDAPFEKSDYGMVVFERQATNSMGETLADRWGPIQPVQLVPDANYVRDLINSVDPSDADSLVFTAVGYGIGEAFPIPGEETGPAIPATGNLETFPVRYIADHLTFLAYNPQNDVLRLSMNIALGENGTCNGDSGGPIFYEEADGDLIEVSLVSGGDYPCRATNTGPGFGFQSALDFAACGRVAGGAAEVSACVSDLFAAGG